MSRLWNIVAVALIVIMGLISSCSDGSQEASPTVQTDLGRVPRTRELPTLYPTGTVPPTLTPANTRLPQPTQLSATGVAFDQLVVDIIYTIPSLGLERRIRGNVAGEIEVIDESSGTSITLKNRPGVIVEMQQALPRATIEELPSDCDSCVQITYELPLTDQSGDGWLNDVQLLASVENYLALILGPHFPADTVIGLRREATPYEVAHSVAIMSDGQLWAWTATQAEIPKPGSDEGILEESTASLDQIDWDSLPASVGYICYQGGGRESLLLSSPDGPRLIEVRCPELYLPGQLVPSYKLLSEAAGDTLEGSDVSLPELPITLDTRLLYRRSDGASLTMAEDGQLKVIDGEGSIFTSTVTTTQVISLTNLLSNNLLLESGPSVIFDEDPGNVILLRADDGVYEFSWTDESERPEGVVSALERLLELVIQGSAAEIDNTPEPTPTAAETDDP